MHEDLHHDGIVLLELPDDDPVFDQFDPNDTRDDHGHDFVYATRWDAEREDAKMVWGHKPPSRPNGNASYTRVFSRVKKCRVCGIVTSGICTVDCGEWGGSCNTCGADTDPEAENFGRCDDCRGPHPVADREMVEKVFYHDRRKRRMKARGDL